MNIEFLTIDNQNPYLSGLEAQLLGAQTSWKQTTSMKFYINFGLTTRHKKFKN
jgi:hypothetical protein